MQEAAEEEEGREWERGSEERARETNLFKIHIEEEGTVLVQAMALQPSTKVLKLTDGAGGGGRVGCSQRQVTFR